MVLHGSQLNLKGIELNGFPEYGSMDFAKAFNFNRTHQSVS